MSELRNASDIGAICPSYLDDFGLSVHQFRIYMHVARRAGGGVAWPGVTNIARVCLCKEETVRRAIADLVKMKMIKQTKRPGFSNLIELTHATVWISPEKTMTNQEDAPPVSRGTPPNGTPVWGEGCTPVSGEGYPSRLGGDEGVPLKESHEGVPSLSPAAPTTTPPPGANEQRLINEWNSIAEVNGLAKAVEWTASRRKMVKARLKEFGTSFHELFAAAAKECATTEWARTNRVSIDHLLRPDNFQRYLDASRTPKTATTELQRPAQAPQVDDRSLWPEKKQAGVRALELEWIACKRKTDAEANHPHDYGCRSRGEEARKRMSEIQIEAGKYYGVMIC